MALPKMAYIPSAKKIRPVDPSAAATAASLATLLANTAQADTSNLCGGEVTEEELGFSPYGAADCHAAYARMEGSPFRSGLRSHFTTLKANNQKDVANKVVPLATQVIVDMASPLISYDEARDIVWKEYATAIGHFPGPPDGPPDDASAFPSRIPQAVRPGITMTPLPQWPGLPGTQAAPVPMPGIPEGFPNGLTPLEEGDADIEQPAAAEGETPWLLIGIGAAVVIGGGIFLVTRKKK